MEDILQQGQNYLKKSGESSAKTLQHSLRTLKQKWDSVLNKASDRKVYTFSFVCFVHTFIMKFVFYANYTKCK